tara:strand:+ start:802 stop:1077 length:276 start_codon:yes stop_codon:yes gene_type:complete
VVNSAKSGDYYWVITHVTPSMQNGEIVDYHSTRRVPSPETIIPLYDNLNAIEQNNPSKKDGLEESVNTLLAILAEKGVSYDEFMSGLMRND